MNQPLDLNQNPIATKDATILEVETNLAERVKARRQFILKNGLKVFGTSPECGPQTVPDWYDPKAFKHAQKMFYRFGTIIKMGQFYGLMLVLNFYSGLVPLLVTGKSATVSALFTRYLSTAIHLGNWYTYDPFDPASKSFRSLKIVRSMHQQVGGKLNKLTGGIKGDGFDVGDIWMSQWGMSEAQFTFMGFLTVFPKTLGCHLFTPYDFHCFFHFWRVIGYCLGIQDQFNLCSGTDEEIIEHCRQEYYEEWLPKIKSHSEPTGIAMANGIALSMLRIIPVATYNGMMRYAAADFGLDPAQYPLRGYWDYNGYVIIWWTMKVVTRSTIYIWMNSRTLSAFEKVAFWLRSFNAWYCSKRYTGEKYEYKTDARCPFEITDSTYKTAWQHKLH